MRILVDTNVALWSLGRTRQLNDTIMDLLGDPSNDPWISVASVWEVAIKTVSGKIRVDSQSFLDAARRFPFNILEITADHAVAVEKLPLIHGDPFDRMLIAQANVEGLRIVTADYRFGDYDCDPIFV